VVDHFGKQRRWLRRADGLVVLLKAHATAEELAGGKVASGLRRSRCKRAECQATHVLLPAGMLGRRLDEVEVIGAALVARASGAGCRRIGAAAGLVVTISKRSRRDWFVIGFLVAGFIALLPGFYFREHYYLQLLPAVTLLFGLAIARAWNVSAPWRYSAMAGALVALFLPLIGQRNYFLASTLTALSREIYGGNPFPEAIEVARYIEANSTPDESVGVLGSEPEIFFYSHRRSATTLIYSYPLMERHQYAHAMQETMAREIEERRPKFIVFMNVPTSWLIRDDSDRFIFDWADHFLPREYRLDGIADILASGSQYVWGERALTYEPRSPYSISVYRRAN
jgi:hypothetical protein